LQTKNNFKFVEIKYKVNVPTTSLDKNKKKEDIKSLRVTVGSDPGRLDAAGDFLRRLRV